MWQKHINHSYSLTGPLQHTHTHLQTCMSTHASVPPPCCHIHRAARSSVPQTCPTITPPRSRPSRQTITSSILYVYVSIRPSVHQSLYLCRFDKHWRLLRERSNLLFIPFFFFFSCTWQPLKENAISASQPEEKINGG